MTTLTGLPALLDSCVSEGVLTADQATQILARSRATERPGPATAGKALAAEALGYLGGVVVVVSTILIANLYWSGLSTAGRLTEASVEVLPPYTTVVGARFWPGAAWPMMGPPAGELVDLTVQLDDLWAGTTAARLGELLAAAPDPDAALDLLQRYLIRQQQRADASNPLIAEAVRRLMPWQPVEIGRLTEHLAISESQLRRRFLATIGVGPKTLQRTLRFQGYLALAQAGWAARSPAPTGLADVAAAVGYADHAHLTRECRRLSGLTPRELLGGWEDRCGCGHDHAASYQPFLASHSRRPLSA